MLILDSVASAWANMPGLQLPLHQRDADRRGIQMIAELMTLAADEHLRGFQTLGGERHCARSSSADLPARRDCRLGRRRCAFGRLPRGQLLAQNRDAAPGLRSPNGPDPP